MRWLAVVTLLLNVYLPGTALARARGLDEARGELVSVAVTVDTRAAPLYASPETADRWYLEAREGSTYALHLTNLTPERLGLRVTVDGLDVISGDRVASPPRRGQAGRLYVLDAWGRMTVRGWRTSLKEVRRFTFVDEETSYAARSGNANSRMGWIEVTVLRERERPLRVTPRSPAKSSPADRTGDSESAPALESAAGTLRQHPRRRSYPGTGWGSRVTDRATLVHFDAERNPAESVVLRYEYRETLCALGIGPSRRRADRLLDRERGEPGFARPPKW
jgi:hypothetical protein